MRLYAEMLEECKKDLANVIKLIEIEKKRSKQNMKSAESEKHNRRMLLLAQERAELAYKVRVLSEKARR